MFRNIFKNLNKLFLSLFGRKPKIMTTFNGIGAFSYALKLLGIEIGEQVYCELNDAANKTYRFNNKFHLSKFVNDVNKLLVLVKRGERYDILIQSPECQSFSAQGKRQGLKSLSGNLFLTAIKLQKKIDSSIVIYENVKGLITHEKFIYTYEKENGEQFQTREKIKDKELEKRKLKKISEVEDSYASLINPLYDGKKKSIGLTLRVIEEQLLEDERYNYYWKIINAADQGIPQARERIIIIGIKKELDGGFKFPENIELQFTVEDILETNVDESYIYKNKENHELILSNKPKRKNQIYTYGKYKGIKYDSDSRVLNPYLASTILTGNNTKFKIGDVIRKLTPNENKKLNGFGDEFQFPVSKTDANTQNGNTVVTWVYARVIESLLNSIKPTNSDTKFIKKELVGKYSMNYHFMREEVANEYMDFISNGGKVVVQIDKYNSKEDKKQKINHQTYFIDVEEFEKLTLINPKYNTYRYKIKGKVSKYLFAYEEPLKVADIENEEDYSEYKTQQFNNASTLGCKKNTVIGKINYKNKIVDKYLKKIDSSKNIDIEIKVSNTKPINNNKYNSTKKIKTIYSNNLEKLINPYNTVLYTWAGSKRKFAPKIQTAISDMKMKNVEYCIDAFGGSLSFTILNISKIKAQNYVINDLDPILTSTYKGVKEDYKKVQEYYLEVRSEFLEILPVKLIKNTIKEEFRPECVDLKYFYQNTIDRLNKSTNIFEIAGLFIFSMEYMTNGMLQYDKNNMVKSTNFNWKCKTQGKLKHIEYYSYILNKYNVIIENLDVFELIKKYEKYSSNSFIYLDPPYLDCKHIYNSDASLEFQSKLIDETNKFKYRLYSNEDCNDLYTLGIDTHFQNEYRFNRPGKQLGGKEYLGFSINEAKSNLMEVAA